MKKYIFIFLMSLSFVACEWLDRVPENDIETVETIFEQRKMLKIGYWLHIVLLKIWQQMCRQMSLISVLMR